MISKETLAALEACGRERVMSREYGSSPGVAIRLDAVSLRGQDKEERFLVVEAASPDQAGREVAAKYAERLRATAKALNEQADRIVAALKKGPTP